MSEIGDNVAVMGDWVPPSPSPSPRAFFSSIAAASADDTGIGELSVGTRKLIMAKGTDSKDAAQTKDAQMAELCSLSDQKLSSRGGLMERIAARAGFNAPRLNTESIRSADLSPNPEIRSPYLTIPPGLSPTTLLDSPVFLSSSLAPSPTTGRFSVLPNGINKSSELVSESADKSKHNFFEGISPTSFAFKPLAEPAPSFFLGAMSKMSPTMFLQHGHPSAEVPVQSESSFLLHGQETIKLESQSRNNLNILAELGRASPKKETGDNTITASQRVFDSNGSTAEHSSPLDEQQDEDHKASAESTIAACGGGGSPSEDGYNWRKYGQKQVKGSEYPRSYYKCTHSSCLVKKKVERSHEGHITEIIYKGAHNHSKPPPGRRSSVGSSNALIDMQLDIPEQIRPHSGADHDSVWANAQKGTTTRTRDWRQDSIIEATSSAYSELRNPPRNQGQNGAHFESRDAVDASPTLSNDEDEDDRATHASVGYDGEEDDSESKRRKIETYPTEMGGATRAIREPRVVVQTTSEVDILDDGYRWRKYGQKVVKGNPNPRSYYKCTSAGCLVRKHVERASHDLKSVITTYEGKHNHDVPAARNSSHANTGQAATASAASVQTHVHRPEPLQVHNPMPTMFDRSAPLASFTLPGRHQMGATPGFSFGMHHHHHSLANLAMAGFRPGQPKMPVMPLHPHLQQQRPINGMGLVLPKGEPKVEPMTEPALDLTNNLSVYQQIMSKLPLGP